MSEKCLTALREELTEHVAATAPNVEANLREQLAGSISERETLTAELEKIVAICEQYGCCASFYAGHDYAFDAVRRFRQWADGRNTDAKESRAAVARLTTENSELTMRLALKLMELGDVPDPRIGTTAVDVTTILRDTTPNRPIQEPRSLTPDEAAVAVSRSILRGSAP